MKTQDRQSAQTSPAPAPGIDWRMLVVWTGLAIAVSLVVMMAVFGEVIPPIALFAILYGVAGFLARRPGKSGAIMMAILSVLLIVLNLPFIIPALSVPASTVDFLTTAVTVTLALANLVAAVAWLRKSSTGARAALAGRATVALLVLVVAIAVAGRITYDAPVVQSGDIEVTTQDFAFSTDVIEASSGEVSVFVKNNDQALHTFTVEGLDVDLTVPGGSTARVTFDAPPGSYEFICRPHLDEMNGTLEVN